MENTIQYTITPVYSVVRQVRRDVEANLGAVIQKSHLDASLICATELIENAMKYGESVPNFQYIQFQLTQGQKGIEISVSNGVVSVKDVDTVASTIDQIKAAGDPTRLYFKRLKDLMGQVRPGTSKLGLLRIATEAEFNLDYKIENDTLTVIARREWIPMGRKE